jgi:dTDP-4-amino-4,6-dideoxygalactose transaminase
MAWRVPFFDLSLDDEDKAAVMSVLESNWLAAGPQTAAFEAEFAEAVGLEASQAVAVTNCTAALHLSLATLGIGPGDEVLVPTLTFVATANAVRYCGATPVFVDIRSSSDWTMCPEDCRRKISPATRAIMPMHFGGHACDLPALQALAQEHKLHMVEDVAHAPLGRLDGRALGTWGDAGCFSFFGNKNMTTGEGGMIICRDEKIADKSRLLRSHALTTTTYQRYQGYAYGYEVEELGYNYRIDEMRAALGRVQLKKLAKVHAKRERLASHYMQLLRERLPELEVPFTSESPGEVWHVFTVCLPEADLTRPEVMRALGELGIQTSIHYRPLHTLKTFTRVESSLPITDTIASRILSLPLYPSMELEDVELVIEGLSQVLGQALTQAV